MCKLKKIDMDKAACNGAPTISEGEMKRCEACGKSVAWDLVDHGFFGFKSSCTFKDKRQSNEK
jgi:hypothetical protein